MEVVHTTTVVASCGRCASEITSITCIPVGIGKYRIVLDPCKKCIDKAIVTALEKQKESLCQ